jgi:hypothetical protein
MVYPTMPFNAPRVVDDWPDIRTTLGYGNWLGLPEVSVPAGYGADGMPALNLSIVGLPGEDAQVLAWAHAFERQAPRFEAPPRSISHDRGRRSGRIGDDVLAQRTVRRIFSAANSYDRSDPAIPRERIDLCGAAGHRRVSRTEVARWLFHPCRRGRSGRPCHA